MNMETLAQMKTKSAEPLSTRAGFAERGGWWVISQALLMISVAVLGPVYPAEEAPGWRRWSGAGALGGLGAALGIAGGLRLGRSRTAFPRPLEACRLVTTGIYGWVRHPLYASLIFLGFAWSVGWGSLWAAVAALAQVVFFFAKAKREEAWLRERFPAYEAYSRRVKRFIPGIW